MRKERRTKKKQERRDILGGPTIILIFNMLVRNENMDLCEGRKMIYTSEMEHALHVEMQHND